MFSAFRSPFGAVFGGALAGLVFLLRDDFTTDRAAGAVNGTAAEPGPGGNRTVVDTESKMPISAGKLVFGSKASPAFGDPGIWYGAQSRVTGLAYHAQLNHLNADLRALYGFYSASGQALPLAGIYYQIGGSLLVYFGSGSNLAVSTHTPGNRDIFVIARSTGYHFIEDTGSGYKLLYVSNVGSTASLYPGATNFASADPVDTVRAIDLPANGYTVWSDDYGIATERYAGSVSAGQAFTHEANCLIEFIVVSTAGVNQSAVQFRRQDANNAWEIRFHASFFRLYERVGGTLTLRTNATAPASGSRVVVIADGTTIRGYVNNSLQWTYSSATNFLTQTAGAVSELIAPNAISDLISWPRTLSGEAATSLDAVVNA